jgi:hypothetical protein
MVMCHMCAGVVAWLIHSGRCNSGLGVSPAVGGLFRSSVLCSPFNDCRPPSRQGPSRR